MKKFLSFVSIIFLFFNLFIISYSATIEIDSCQTLGSGNTYLINSSFSDNITNPCFTGANNVVLNCQSHTISSNFSGRIWDVYGSDNVTIKNCNFNNFDDGLRLRGGDTNYNLSNLNISNIVTPAIYLESISNSTFENININNVSTAFYFLNGASDYNTFNNILVTNSNIGIALSGTNNSFNNINIINTTIPIQFQSLNNLESTFKNSYLGNSSLWGWKTNLNISSTYFLNNYYTNFNGSIPFCVYSTACDINPNNLNSNNYQNTQILPATNYMLTILILILYFII